MTILFLLFILPTSLFGQIYEHKKINGDIYFSDRPVASLTQIDLNPSYSIEKNQTDKKTLEILSPGYDSYFLNQSEILVKILLSPSALKQGETLQIWLDGTFYSYATQNDCVLRDLIPGTHVITAKWFDANKRILAASASVKFHVHYKVISGEEKNLTVAP